MTHVQKLYAWVINKFIGIFVLSSFYLFIFFRISIKKILLIALITLITTSPYLIRNFLIFEKVTIQAGFGFNVWKSNNPNSKVEGSTLIDDNLQKQIDEIPKDKFYRINEDKIFLGQAIEYIKKEPKPIMQSGIMMKKIVFLKPTATTNVFNCWLWSAA